ncbi:MAG: GspE/PulE family protein [Planctomycetota bacterium]|jgi:type II secretory ATPase GspE/PulE/Tfp pilus assembly ATPase PilB-like protein|nr:GspE/PulE family protein [Planctomycetota bacterium]
MAAAIDLDRVIASRAALDKVPAKLAHRLGVLPVALDNDTLIVVQSNADVDAGIMQLEGQLGLEIRVAPVRRPEGVEKAIRRYYPENAGTGTPLALLEELINRALQIHCSDIHLDSESECAFVRMRVDGLMRIDRELTPEAMTDLVSAVKVSSRLDISEKRIPQDGQLTIESLGEEISMRVATIPTLRGEKVTLRILATAATAAELSSVDSLGMCDLHREMFLSTLRQAHGIVLLSGPTGSGKTTTLYAALRHLRTPGTAHIMSIEDPVEIPMDGVNQVHVDSERVSFNKALRSVMRHDPDIIMIGEIRDAESADIAVKSALTGHLVLSTLHANDSVSVVTRLTNLGVARELVAATLRLVIAQRLVRRPCAHCRRLVPCDGPSADAFRLPPETMLVEPAECQLCGGGYSGRVGLYEMVPIRKRERELIMSGAGADAMAEHAFGDLGLPTLFQDGRAKALEHLTTLSEIRRVIYLGEEQ